jgi:hypothetical protein
MSRDIFGARPSHPEPCCIPDGPESIRCRWRSNDTPEVQQSANVIVGRDWYLSNRVASVALAPVEDLDNYFWFSKRIKSHGFPVATVPVFTDHHKGIITATIELGILNMY